MSSLVNNFRNLNENYCNADVISTVLVDFLNPQIITSYLQYFGLWAHPFAIIIIQISDNKKIFYRFVMMKLHAVHSTFVKKICSLGCCKNHRNKDIIAIITAIKTSMMRGLISVVVKKTFMFPTVCPRISHSINMACSTLQ